MERETDIDFEFFDDEPETREAARPERPIRGGPRRPPVRPPTGVTPLLRLVGLIAFAILIVVLLVYAIQGCESSSKHSKYAHYMDHVRDLAIGSQRIGGQLNAVLTTPGLKQADLIRRLNGLARAQEQGVENARTLDPPGRLRSEHEHVLEALEFRASGLTGLADSVPQALRMKNVNAAGALLAAPAERLLASDVIWDDTFKDPAIQVLKAQGVGDVRVPDSNFLQNPDFVSQRSMAAVVQRIKGATTGVRTGGLHGTSLVSTKALPSGIELVEGQQSTIKSTSTLAFAVTIEDSGDSQEVHIPITLTIKESPSPITKHEVVDVINPGEQKTVVFTNLGTVAVATPTTIRVSVQPVPGEHNTSNNTADYPVIFTL